MVSLKCNISTEAMTNKNTPTGRGVFVERAAGIGRVSLGLKISGETAPVRVWFLLPPPK